VTTSVLPPRRPHIAFLVSAIAGLLAACAPPRPDNLVFISLDTTRKDHLSAYGYPRDTSPRLAHLAAESAVFLNGEAQWTVTNPSHTSMFTGVYPHTHGVGENTSTLAEEFITLTEILDGSGFRTGAFVSGFPLRPKITGIDRGFRVFNAKFSGQRRNCEQTTEAALAWLRKLAPEERFFLFVHFYDAHGPFTPKPEYLEMFRSAEAGPELDYIPKYQRITDEAGNDITRLNDFIDRYDAQLRYQDDCFGQILDAVDLDRTLVTVVADHGETLGDRERPYNLNHGTSVFAEQTGIPFLIYTPGRQPGRFPLPVETIDLMPTLLELLEVPSPPGLKIEGQSLVPTIEDLADRQSQKRLAFSTTRIRFRPPHRGYNVKKDTTAHMVRSERWKLIVYEGVHRDYVELYDLQRDPGETTNVAEEFPDQREALFSAFDAWRKQMPVNEPSPELSPEDLENLRALGYLGN